MKILQSYLPNFNFSISPVYKGEIIVIVSLIIVAVYIFYSLNLFKKED